MYHIFLNIFLYCVRTLEHLLEHLILLILIHNIERELIQSYLYCFCNSSNDLFCLKTTGIAQIHVADNGDNQIVIVAGANNELSIEDIAATRETIDSSKVLVCQMETPLKSTFAALRGFKGVSILNASPVPTENSLEIYTLPTILCVNELEAAAMTNRKVPNIE